MGACLKIRKLDLAEMSRIRTDPIHGDSMQKVAYQPHRLPNQTEASGDVKLKDLSTHLDSCQLQQMSWSQPSSPFPTIWVWLYGSSSAKYSRTSTTINVT